MSLPPRQLALSLRLHDDATFDNFWAEAANQQLLQALRANLSRGEGSLYLYGAEGSGRSHLLQAACHDLAERGALYLPLRELSGANPQALLDGLAELPLLCLDDIDQVSGDADWAEALFHLFNRGRSSGQILLISAGANPASIDCVLPDLRSRLAWLDCYRLQPLDDAGRLQALQYRARRRGLELGDDVARFILHRYPRNPGALFAFLDELDRRSLAAQRRLTIPFVREVMAISL